MKYSNFDEENIIKKILSSLKIEKGVCVDIGAADGITSSNTYPLFKEGWSGLAIERVNWLFKDLAIAYEDLPHVILLRQVVTPDNIAKILRAFCGGIDFLSLDIDGYDYFVLDGILEGGIRPKLICIEINQNIPPPIKFSVKYSPEYVWDRSMFFGHSISLLGDLCKAYNYTIIGQEYTNAFLMPIEICPIKGETPEEAYYRGFYDRPDVAERVKPFEKVKPFIDLLRTLPDQKKLDLINGRWGEKYKDKYILSI